MAQSDTPGMAVPLSYMMRPTASEGIFSTIGPREIAAFDAELPYLHKERWAMRSAELHRELKAAATQDERNAIERLIDAHRDNRFKPETSRDAIIAQAKANVEAKRQQRHAAAVSDNHSA